MSQQRGARRTSGWVIGRVAGVPVVLSPSWLLVAGLILLIYFPFVQRVLGGADAVTIALTTLGFVVVLFVSVLLHELAHGMTAARYGSPAREYVVTFWGGHTAFDRDLSSPGASAVVSAAGPAANLVLAAAAWAATRADLPTPLWIVLWGATITNALVAGFNLLPGLPLDGGRVLEALVWKVTGRRYPGTVAAAWGGRVVAGGLAVWALGVPLLQGRSPDLTTIIWVALLASVLWSGASQALASAKVHRAAEGLDLRPLARPVLLVPAGTAVAELDVRAPETREADGPTVVLMRGEVPVAVVDVEALAAIPPQHRASTPLDAVARTLYREMVVGHVTGPEAVAAVARAQRHTSEVLLTQDRQVLGMVRVADVARALGRPA
ncbi:site-2 protease family protein [Georgenia muralis]|uniref:site-2 protease family protein n=1 Tax=Georgenia muralis TaxID=154117 RepID=UPI000F514285|nr:site-2 protease family protein [Georgenia muralis]